MTHFLKVLLCLVATNAHAGVFDLPAFIEEGHWSVGAEPELTISHGTGFGVNFKPRVGISDLLDVEGTVGFGTGNRRFRVGMAADFEFFPDIEKQPGIATAFFFDYFKVHDDGLFRFGAKPMIYKTFSGEEAEYTPFIAVPLGWNVRSSQDLTTFVEIALGAIFKIPGYDKWRFIFEGGFEVKDSYSYISGGVTYYY